MQPRLTQRAGVGTVAQIVQRQPLRLAQVPIDAPVLIVVVQGSKTIESPGGELTLQAGDAIALAGGQSLSVTNRGADAAGSYEARWLVWDRAVLDARRDPACATRASAPRAWPLPRVGPAFMRSFNAAFDAVSQADELPVAIARHRLIEMLLWLEERGVRLSAAAPSSTAARLRGQLGAAPEQPWTAAEAAATLAMSEATLRRRLAAEGSSFGMLLTDVRMAHGLMLLQATDRPVWQVALAAGYDSASRFAQRFRRRFGFAPSSVRGHRRDVKPLA